MADDRFDLPYLLGLLRRRWWLVVLVAVLATGLALAYSLVQDERYEAGAELLFGRDQLSRTIFGGSEVSETRAPERVAATNLELASLDVLAVRVKRKLNSRLPLRDLQERVDAQPRGEADLVTIVGRGPTPASARRLAQTFAREVVAFRRENAKREVQSAIDALERQIELGDVPPAVSRSRRRRVEQLEVIKALEGGDVEIIESARLPLNPAAPNTRQNALVGGVLGLFLGAGLVLLLDRLGRRVRDDDEIVELARAPVIARIPKRPRRLLGKPDDEGVHEALQFVRANPTLRGGPDESRVVAITSPEPRDGKTLVTASLSSVLAVAGERVLAVDCDLRKPDLHRIFSVPLERGVADVLSDSAPAASVVTTVGESGVRLLTAGASAPAAPPSALLGPERLSGLVAALRVDADFVLIDTPPLSVAADASEVAGVADATLLVVDARTRRKSLELACEQLDQAQANVLGVIVNRAKIAVPGYSSYGQRRRGPFRRQRGKARTRVAASPSTPTSDDTPAT